MTVKHGPAVQLMLITVCLGIHVLEPQNTCLYNITVFIGKLRFVSIFSNVCKVRRYIEAKPISKTYLNILEYINTNLLPINNNITIFNFFNVQQNIIQVYITLIIPH